jgi:hypothetical protein
MRRLASAAAGIALMFVFGAAMAQQIEWKKTIDTPKGLNLPKDVSGDILGIQLGDTYAEVKAKLQKLMTESIVPPQPGDDPIIESTTTMRLQTPGGGVGVSYVGRLQMTRTLKGSVPAGVRDFIDVKLSAPSSGNQAVGIRRTITYFVPADEARVADVVAAVKAKYKAEPQRVSDSLFRFMFDNGRNFVPPHVDPNGCRPQYDFQGPLQAVLASMNPKGDCDVVIQVEVQFGMSRESAQSVTFTLSDNERARLNLAADLAFLDAYVRDLQNRTKGNTPKL